MKSRKQRNQVDKKKKKDIRLVSMSQWWWVHIDTWITLEHMWQFFIASKILCGGRRMQQPVRGAPRGKSGTLLFYYYYFIQKLKYAIALFCSYVQHLQAHPDEIMPANKRELLLCRKWRLPYRDPTHNTCLSKKTKKRRERIPFMLLQLCVGRLHFEYLWGIHSFIFIISHLCLCMRAFTFVSYSNQITILPNLPVFDKMTITSIFY